MADRDMRKDETETDALEVEPLSDEALDTVAGGLLGGSSDGCCSCSNCSKEAQ